MTRRSIPDLLPGTPDMAHPAYSADAAAPWLGDRGADRADFRRCLAGQLGLALSGTPSPRAPGLDRSGMGRVGAGPASQVLPAHALRTPPTGGRNRRVGTDVRRHRARDEAGVSACGPSEAR